MKTQKDDTKPTAGNEELRLSIQVLGPLVVRRGDCTMTSKELGGPRQRQVLEILLLHLGTPVSKTRLVDLLWAEQAPAAAAATLESYVSVLRRRLQPGAGRNGALRTTNGGYVMDATMVDLDLHTFDLLLETARCCSAREAYPLLRRALKLASGPLLENELLSEWTDSQRSLHAARVNEARVLASEAGLQLGLPQEALAQARLVLAEEPLNERAWTVLVLGLERSGQLVEGLQAYDRFRRLLQDELGCAPARIVQDACQRMLHATAGSDNGLGKVLSALLLLHRQIDVRDGLPDPSESLSRRQAAMVIQEFLGRSLSPAG
jgi:DNA-binding SARP family transcriptional activator